MDAEKIIKALQLCTSGDIYCGECPYEDTPRCRYVSLVDALDLIMSQRIKIINLESENKQLEIDVFNATMNLGHLQQELTKAQKLIADMFPYVCSGCKENIIFHESDCDSCIWKTAIGTYCNPGGEGND